MAGQAHGRDGVPPLSGVRAAGTTRELNERLYAAAESRLGRTLHPGERHVDIATILAELDAGKHRLRRAVQKEQKRVAEQAAEGRHDVQMHVTDEMVAALNWLREQGVREARRELARHGVRPATARTFARPRTSGVRALANRLAGWLPTISVRTRGRAVQLQLAGEAQRAILESAARVPGALDAASRLVSSAYYGGMGDVFSNSASLISGWTYSAILDGGTCPPCEDMDGTHYDTWEEAEEDMPGGGPNPDCDGDGRCRCRLVPEGPAEEQTGPSAAATVAEAESGGYAAAAFADPLESPALDAWTDATATVGVPRLGAAPHLSAGNEPLTASSIFHADGLLYDVAEAQGFNGLPTVASEEQLDTLVHGGGTELYRGIASGGTRTAADFAKDFREGDFFAGEGVAGNGTYAADASVLDSLRALDVATDYSGISGGATGDDGVVLRMVLHRDARVIEYDDAKVAYREFSDARGEEINAARERLSALAREHGEDSPQVKAALEKLRRIQVAKGLYGDIGRWATAAGYDAIRVGARGHMVVLNRTALTVSRMNRISEEIRRTAEHELKLVPG